MKKMSRLLMAVAASLSAIAAANAADLTQPRVVTYAPAEAPAATGWYLRGDVGVGITTNSTFYDSYIAAPAAGQTTGWLNHSVQDSTNIDVGLGYQFTDNLRGDITVQYRTATSFQGANFITNNGNGSTGQNVMSGSVSSVVGLANGYYDIVHWNGLTPYVGAGVGFAINRTSATSIQQGGFNPPIYGVFAPKNQANFAWALHTGISYDINPRLKLELGYSYLNLGDAKTGNATCYGSPCTNEYFKIKNMSAHDIHLGMRWMFDAPAAQTASWQPAYSSAPVVARY